MKNNKNNKGFTMVELIIVIAILAILMVALVPQFIAYVERAKESNDSQIAKNLEEAIEIAVIDPKNDFAGVAFNVTWTGSTGAIEDSVVVATTDIDAIMEDVEEVMGGLTFAPDSTAAKASGSVFMVNVAADGKVTTTWTGVDFWE